jgi:hypothetical protein
MNGRSAILSVAAITGIIGPVFRILENFGKRRRAERNKGKNQDKVFHSDIVSNKAFSLENP